MEYSCLYHIKHFNILVTRGIQDIRNFFICRDGIQLHEFLIASLVYISPKVEQLEYNSVCDEGLKNSIIFSKIYKIVLGL
jgi:hypothetical protein